MSQRIQELKRLRAKAIADARAIIDNATKEARNISAEERSTVDKFHEEIDAISNDIVREETQLRNEKFITESANEAGQQPENRASQVFEKLLRHGKDSLSEAEVRTLTVGTDADGGYTVAPTDFQARLIEAAENATFIYKAIEFIRMAQAKTITMPKLTAGFADADWNTEVGEVTEDTSMQFGTFTLTPHDLDKEVKISKYLLSESNINILGLISRKLGYAFGVTAEKAIISGNGSGKPAGILTTTGISTARDLTLGTGNATTLIQSAFDTFKKAKYNMRTPYQANAEWLMHRNVYSLLTLLKDDNGAYLINSSNKDNDFDMINGKKINLSEYMTSSVSAGGYIAILGDMKYIYGIEQTPYTVQRLDELYAKTKEVGFIAHTKMDLKVAQEEAFVRIKASAS